MREEKHTYANVKKEEKYINDMLQSGYRLIRVEESGMYCFESCEPRKYACKVLLAEETEYVYFESVCRYVEVNDLFQVNVSDRKNGMLRIYVIWEMAENLDDIPYNYECVIKECKKQMKQKTCSVALAMMFATIFISKCYWIAVAEIIVAVIYLVEIAWKEKEIKEMKLRLQGENYV